MDNFTKLDLIMKHFDLNGVDLAKIMGLNKTSVYKYIKGEAKVNDRYLRRLEDWMRRTHPGTTYSHMMKNRVYILDDTECIAELFDIKKSLDELVERLVKFSQKEDRS